MSTRSKSLRRALIAACTLSLVAGCRQVESLPPELAGTWLTDAPHYAGRSFTFRLPDTLILQAGPTPESINTHKIRSVKSEFDRGMNATLYRIGYSEGGDEMSFSLYLFTQPARTVRFKNQPEIAWKPLEPRS